VAAAALPILVPCARNPRRIGKPATGAVGGSLVGPTGDVPGAVPGRRHHPRRDHRDHPSSPQRLPLTPVCRVAAVSHGPCTGQGCPPQESHRDSPSTWNASPVWPGAPRNQGLIALGLTEGGRPGVVAGFICSDCQLATVIYAGQAGIVPGQCGLPADYQSKAFIEGHPAPATRAPAHKITTYGCMARPGPASSSYSDRWPIGQPSGLDGYEVCDDTAPPARATSDGSIRPGCPADGRVTRRTGPSTGHGSRRGLRARVGRD
jgi:hypothetical protein